MNRVNDYRIVGWDVDTQRDFMEGIVDNAVNYEGRLKISDAMSIVPQLDMITTYLRKQNIPIMGSVDWHNDDSVEFSQTPDFVNTFPAHCIGDHYGAEKIDVARPVNPIYIDWETEQNYDAILKNIVHHDGEVFFRKDRFDVFDIQGNPYASDVVKDLGVEKAIVYGVALEVCNDAAFGGLVNRGVEVYAVEDAMKAINEEVRSDVLGRWKSMGVNVVKLEDVIFGGVVR